MGVLYVVSMVRALASRWDVERRRNEGQDVARAEIRENVRRIANGSGVQYDDEAPS